LKLELRRRPKGLVVKPCELLCQSKSKVKGEAAMVKNVQSKDVEQMTLIELATLQANVMDRVIAGEITPLEADVISNRAERRMRLLKQELSFYQPSVGVVRWTSCAA
jgi:hypothetical protein